MGNEEVLVTTYTLRHQDWSCQICPEYGANVISLRHKDFPILREPASIHALKDTPALYGTPLLLPPNRTAGGRFRFEQQEYVLPINEPLHNNHLHGFLHSTKFQVIARSEDSLTTHFVNHGEVFPFPFEITMTDTLHPEGYRRTLTITNTGTSAMPLVLAFHTTFTAPDSFLVPIRSCWTTDEHHIPTGEKAMLTPEQQAYQNGCSISGQIIRGFYEASGQTARIGDYLFSAQGFDQWILFNGDGTRGFLCIEPQLGPVNALNSGHYHRLECGKSYEFTLEITCLH